MKNRNIQFVAVFCLVAPFLTACTKLIEIPENPPSKIPGEVLFADSAGIMSAWTGIYTGFNPTQLNFYSAGVTILTGLASDELITSPNGFQGDVGIMNNDILSTEGRTTSYWRDAYVNLLRINSCLENIQGTTAISARLKNQLIGEAKVARAYTYFHLVNLYGGVPLITGTNYEVNKRVPRATADAVYDLILNDLTEAKGLLMDEYPSEGRARPNKMVANALLARVYLYRGEWNDAELAATAVISSGAYSLAPLSSIFLKGSNEAIWQLPSNGNFSQTAEGFNFIPAPWNSYPDFILSPRLEFEAGDTRETAWTSTMTVEGTPYPYPAKYKQRELSGSPAEDYVLLRLAEMYLIRAEARARQGENADAVSDLNEMRNPARVGLPVYSGPVNSADIITAILKERRIEFYCEGGHRWYDLKRTGTIDQVLGAKSPGNWQSTDALFPIPDDQRILNPFLTQNPGYQ